MECAERLGRRGLKGHVHVKKEKAANGVCGAAGEKGYVHAKKKKIGNGVCGTAGEIGVVHVKKEKAENGVCGATPNSAKLPYCTRQKEKSRK